MDKGRHSAISICLEAMHSVRAYREIQRGKEREREDGSFLQTEQDNDCQAIQPYNHTIQQTIESLETRRVIARLLSTEPILLYSPYLLPFQTRYRSSYWKLSLLCLFITIHCITIY